MEKEYKELHTPLRFDYYLPKYNLLIEVQGLQHFRPSTMGADITEEQVLQNFTDLQERDQLKRDYCKAHHINLIEIVTRENFEKFDNFILKTVD